MTLVYLTYLLALNPHIRERIQAELDAALSDRDHLLFVNELDRLQYLGVVIKETLRLHPAVSGDLPRWVPGGGAVIDGFFLPGKVPVVPLTGFVPPLTLLFRTDCNQLPALLDESHPRRFRARLRLCQPGSFHRRGTGHEAGVFCLLVWSSQLCWDEVCYDHAVCGKRFSLTPLPHSVSPTPSSRSSPPTSSAATRSRKVPVFLRVVAESNPLGHSLAPETTPASMVPTESFFTAPIAMATRVQLHPR